jgi:hypothetical protein
MNTTVEELLEVIFPVWSVPRLYNEDELHYERAESLQADRQSRAAVLRSKRLVAEARDSLGA